MIAQPRPYVWQMIREAIDALGGAATNVAVRDWILGRYPGTKVSTIQAQTTVCTVNHASRIHYPENRKPRTADTQYDFLFRPERGKLELYDLARHGVWEIVEGEDGRLRVCQADVNGNGGDESGGEAFAAETHLRDYLTNHLEVIEPGLQLFVDEDGTAGVEYLTAIGRIDLLAVDTEEGLVVIELKVSRGPDAVCGQLLRYKGWVKRHLANGRRVRGFIVAQHISDRIRYALADAQDVYLKEYVLNITLRDVPHIDTAGAIEKKP
jgi:RecB family endonuclease NucS